MALPKASDIVNDYQYKVHKYDDLCVTYTLRLQKVQKTQFGSKAPFTFKRVHTTAYSGTWTGYSGVWTHTYKTSTIVGDKDHTCSKYPEERNDRDEQPPKQKLCVIVLAIDKRISGYYEDGCGDVEDTYDDKGTVVLDFVKLNNRSSGVVLNNVVFRMPSK